MPGVVSEENLATGLPLRGSVPMGIKESKQGQRNYVLSLLPCGNSGTQNDMDTRTELKKQERLDCH